MGVAAGLDAEGPVAGEEVTSPAWTFPQPSDATTQVGCVAGLIRAGFRDLPCALGPSCE